MSQPCVALVVGRRGSGKSWLARRMVKEAVSLGRLVIVHDPLADWDAWRESGEEYLKNDCVRIECGKEAEDVAAMAVDMAPCTIVFDEVSLALPVERRSAAPTAQEIMQFGRHLDVGMVGCTQRPSLCSLDFRALATDYFVFQLRAERDIQWIDKNVDSVVAAKAKILRPLQYIHFSA